MLVIQYQTKLKIGAHAEVREIWIVIAFGFWQWAAMRSYAASGARGGLVFYATMAFCLLPLVLAKVIPVLLLRQFGFLGLSYITFRALDVVFCLRDGVIAAPRLFDFFGFLFFFPTISAGPIDRYRRFEGDWKKRRTRDEFVSDLDGAVHRIFRGFLYKFILAGLIKQYWLDRVASETTFGALVSYMYAYSFYLFFDFAGYSAFAIAFSYLLGVHTPENFNRPFLARNIRDFWNRWHITLSFWFRDHESPIRGETFVTRKITRAVAAIEAGLQDCLFVGNLNARRDWGHARDYVDGMWLILQQPQPDDYVLATGTSHTVREFVERAFVLIGRRLEWKGEGIYEAGVDAVSGKELVKVDPSYFRPTEVDVLVGDASKARDKLGWQHRVNFDDLVKEMVEEDRRVLRGCAEEMNAANY